MQINPLAFEPSKEKQTNKQKTSVLHFLSLKMTFEDYYSWPSTASREPENSMLVWGREPRTALRERIVQSKVVVMPRVKNPALPPPFSHMHSAYCSLRPNRSSPVFLLMPGPHMCITTRQWLLQSDHFCHRQKLVFLEYVYGLWGGSILLREDKC